MRGPGTAGLCHLDSSVEICGSALMRLGSNPRRIWRIDSIGHLHSHSFRLTLPIFKVNKVPYPTTPVPISDEADLGPDYCTAYITHFH